MKCSKPKLLLSLSYNLMLLLLSRTQVSGYFLQQSTRNFGRFRVASNLVSKPWYLPSIRCRLEKRSYSISVYACSSEVRHHPVTNEGKFLEQVETTVARVLKEHRTLDDIFQLPPNQREAFGVAKHLNKRLKAFRRNNDCPRCWLQRVHCVCSKCPPLESSGQPLTRRIKRIFVLMHHKEICLAVDTAKLILAALPETTRLVVGGIGPEYQDSMKDMNHAIQERQCLVLFPADDAKTITQVKTEMTTTTYSNKGDEYHDEKFDVIVIDGTWEQARKLYRRYIPEESNGGPVRIRLGDEALAAIAAKTLDAKYGSYTGRQLRRHPERWREISTLEALRLLLKDVDGGSQWNALAEYQQQADAAAKRQLGAPRT